VAEPAARSGVVAARALAGSACALVLVFASTACGNTAQPRPGPPPRVFAFLSQTGGSELDHLRRYGQRIDVVAPNWYELTLPVGTLSGSPHEAVIALTRAQGAELWPVVNAQLAPGDLTVSVAQRERVAEAIAAAAAAGGYDGITLDIEQLQRSESGTFTALIALVAARLHAQHDHLAVYVPRRTGSDGDQDYDWRSLARSADLLIASGYNEHSTSSPPGPVVTTAGFGHVLDYAAAISRRSIAPAIGAFGYAWPAGGGPGQLISTTDAEALRSQSRAAVRSVGGDTMFRAGGRVVFYQDIAMLDALAHLARGRGMRWLALFSLGREPDVFWAHITTARQAATARTASQ
jgi:spore germination protein YaaH